MRRQYSTAKLLHNGMLTRSTRGLACAQARDSSAELSAAVGPADNAQDLASDRHDTSMMAANAVNMNKVYVNGREYSLGEGLADRTLLTWLRGMSFFPARSRPCFQG